MTALIVIGIILLIFILIGQIRAGVDFSMIDDRIKLSVKVCGFTIQLIPKKKKAEEKQKEEPEQKSEPEKKEEKKPEKKKRKKKKKKPFFKIDQYDIREMLSVVGRGLRLFGRGFRCDRLLLHFTASSWDPYVTAKLSAYSDAFLSAFYPLLENSRNFKNVDIQTGIDFNELWPVLDLGFCVTFRIGAVMDMAFSSLFGLIGVFLKIIFRFLWMKLTDPEEYDFRINQQEGILSFFLHVIRETKAKKAEAAKAAESGNPSEASADNNAAEDWNTSDPAAASGAADPSASAEVLQIAQEYAQQNGYRLEQENAEADS